MDYGALLKRAWNIIWRNKIMWLFGFLIALGSGGGPNANFQVSGPWPGRASVPPEVERSLSQLLADRTLIITIVIVILAVALLIKLILALLAALGHSAMVDMAREADEVGATNFRTGWRTSWRKMLPTFFIRFLVWLPLFVILLAGTIPVLVSLIPLITSGKLREPEVAFPVVLLSAWACLAPACCIGWLLTIPLHVLETLAIRALVLEGHGIWSSFRRSWEVLKTNLGDLIIVWLIVLVIDIGAIIVIALPLSLLAFAVLLPLALAAIVAPILLAPMILVILLLALGSAALRSVPEAYKSTTWTLAYRQWIARPAPAPSEPSTI